MKKRQAAFFAASIVLFVLTSVFVVSAFWPFSTTGKVTDDYTKPAFVFSGASSDGLTGGASMMKEGVDGNAVRFDGSDSYVLVVNEGTRPTKEVTVAGWFNTEALRTGKNEITGSWVSKRDAYVLDAETDGSVKFWVFLNRAWYAVSSPAKSFSVGVWEHWAGTYDGQTISLYKNGALVAKTTASGTLGTTGELCIGHDCNLPEPYENRYFQGSADEVRIYTDALSSSAIKNLYASQEKKLILTPKGKPNTGTEKSTGSCIEYGDKGKDPDVAGTIVCGDKKYSDECYSSNTVLEYYYDEGIDDYGSVYLNCAAGKTCQNGQCVGSGKMEKDVAIGASANILVVDSTTNAPVTTATVTTTLTGVTYTGIFDGKQYIFSNLPTGLYIFNASAPGYVRGTSNTYKLEEGRIIYGSVSIAPSNGQNAPIGDIGGSRDVGGGQDFCVEGCSLTNVDGSGKCLPFGTRTGTEFCAPTGAMVTQKATAEKCSNGWECKSNVCASGQCVDTGLFNKIIEFFAELFGDDNNHLALAFPKTRGEYVLEKEPIKESFCQKAEADAMQGEICVQYFDGIYLHKNKKESIFVTLVDITKGKELYQKMFEKYLASGNIAMTSKPALFRSGTAGLVWFSEKEYDVIMTHQSRYTEIGQERIYDYSQLADPQHHVIQELLGVYGTDTNIMEKMSEIVQKNRPKEPSCKESDQGRDYFIYGVVTCGAISYPDECFSPKALKERYYDSGIDDWNEEFHDCEYGCEKGACLPKPAEPIKKKEAEILCEQYAESDSGINSVIPGELFALRNKERGYVQENLVSVAKDSCLDKTNLREYSCEYQNNEKSIVRSFDIACPYECNNGGCSLGEKAKTCIGDKCFDLTPQKNCWEGGWSGDKTFIRGGIELYNQEKFTETRQSATDECIDERTKRAFQCTPFVLQTGIYDMYKIPTSKTLSCPQGYSCSEGKCLQNEPQRLAGIGDLNNDGVVNAVDVAMLKELLTKESISYSQPADIDRDQLVDSFDAYLLERRVSGLSNEDMKYDIREFTLTSTNSLFSWENDLLGKMTETDNGKKTEWKVEHKQKGGSRRSCVPPVLNINLKDVKKSQRILGLSRENPSGLRYDEFRLLPDCDIWMRYDADNLIREYFIYWLFRNFGVPAVDTIGFANVKFDTPHHSSYLETGKSYNFLMLQRDNADKDQVPFMKQFNLIRLIEVSDRFRAEAEACKDVIGPELGSCISYNRLSPIIITKSDGNVERLEFDADNALRYFVLNTFATVGDRGYLHNEDYGLDGAGKLKYIPFDFDISFGCERQISTREEFLKSLSLANIPASQRSEYMKKYDAIVREIFDNPDNLNKMLLTIERYPFRANSIKMKNEIRARFYENALYYGSRQFAQAIGQEHKPFIHQAQYLKEARRLAQLENYDSLCHNRFSLQEVIALY